MQNDWVPYVSRSKEQDTNQIEQQQQKKAYRLEDNLNSFKDIMVANFLQISVDVVLPLNIK